MKYAPKIAGILALLLIPFQALAITSAQYHSILDGTVFYSGPSGGSCGAVSGTILTGSSDNRQAALTYFIQKGLTPTQSAGLVGNLYAESSINPMEENDNGAVVDASAPAGQGEAYGIAQWDTTNRQQGLTQLAQSENQPVDSLGVQLDYVWDELTATPPASDYSTVLTALKATTDVQDATNVILLQYEAPVTSSDPTYPAVLQQRTAFAASILQSYGGDVTTASTGSTLATTGDGCATSIGGAACTGNTPLSNGTECIDGFTLYLQFEGPWADDLYGDPNAPEHTIAYNGCGPTSMAMIITTLTGQIVTPDVTAAYALSANQYADGKGSYHTIGAVLAAHWNLQSSLIGADVTKITAALQAGSLVIAEGQGAAPFTSDGHFIVIRAIAPDGQWLVGDPGHDDSLSKQEWSPQALVAEMSPDSVYAISK